MPSRYNSATLPYTSRSGENIYPVSTVKLLAPAVLLWSLMSILPVFQEYGPGEVGQQRSSLKWDKGEIRATGLLSTFGISVDFVVCP